MSKNLWVRTWILSSTLVLPLATAAQAKADILSEPMRCIASPKTFKIEDEDMRFSAIKIFQGKKIVLESRTPGENLEIDCSKSKDPVDVNNKYSFIKQQKKTDPTVSGLMTLFSLGMAQMKKTETDLELTNKTEFPVHTTIKVPDLKDEITVNDSKTGKSFRVECLFPVPSGVRVSTKGQGDKEKVAFFVGSATRTTLDTMPKEVEKTKTPCGATQYSMNIAKASIEKTEIVLANSAPSAKRNAQ